MFGFEIRCLYRGRLYSEWAVVRDGPYGRRYLRGWTVERDPDRGDNPGGQFGLWIEQVFGGLVPDGGWWLWARIGRATPTYRLSAEWAPAERVIGWRPANNGTGPRMYFLVREAVNLRDRYHYGASGQLVRYGSNAAAQKAADHLNRNHAPS